MGFISEPSSLQPVELLREGSTQSLTLLKEYFHDQKRANAGIGDSEVSRELVSELCLRLQVKHNRLRWLYEAQPDLLRALVLEAAVACLEICNSKQMQLMLLTSISLYLSPHVPWSNVQLSTISHRALSGECKSKCVELLDQFTQQTTPNLLSIKGPKFTTVASGDRSNGRFHRVRTTRPALGLSVATNDEETQRAEWKNSDKVTALSSVLVIATLDMSSEASAMCCTFALNVLDDGDPLFRAQGCLLLQSLISLGHGALLCTKGLLPVFEESVKTSLTYLPQLTPAEVSLRLLKDGAYPVLFQLFALDKEATYVRYVEVLDGHLLSSISHVFGRKNDESTNSLLSFLLVQVASVVKDHIGLSVLVCFSRLVLMLNQILADPFLIDTDGGPGVVDATLAVQKETLQLFENSSDLSALHCLLRYKYDFLGAWTILAKRVIKFGVGSGGTLSTLKFLFAQFKCIACRASDPEFESDEQAILSQHPELQQVFDGA